jgi:carbonic anhydrase
LGSAIKKYLEENHLMDNCDIVAAAGAVKNLVLPSSHSDPEFILRQVEISHRLHHISQVILMNHTDCGAYGGRDAFESAETEHNQHVDDMQKAKKMIQIKFNDLEVKMVLVKISPSGQISFEEIK